MIAYNPVVVNNITIRKVDSITLVRLRTLFVLVFSMPFFRIEPLGSPYFTIPFISSYIYLGLCLFSGFSLFNFKVMKGFVSPFVALLILLWVMSIIFYYPQSITAFSNNRKLTLFLFIFIAITNEILLRPFLANQLLATIFASLCFVGILYLAGIGVVVKGGRATIFGINANTLGLYYLVGFLLFLKIFLQGNSTFLKKALLGIFAVLFLYILVRTGSRTSVICLLIGSVIYLVSYDLPFRQKVSFLLIGSVVIIILGAFMFTSDIIQQRFLEEADDETYGMRLPIWEATFNLIYERPWFGSGATGYEANIMKYLGKFRATHNTYLWILAETGIVGSAFFLWLMAKFGRASLTVNRLGGNPFYLAVWFSYMVFFFANGAIFITFDNWVLMAVLVGSSIVLKKGSAIS